MDDFLNEIYSKAYKMEDSVIRQVLSNHLGREATIEDANNSEMVRKEGVFDKYILVHNKVPLGAIYKKFENNLYTVSFEPNDIQP